MLAGRASCHELAHSLLHMHMRSTGTVSQHGQHKCVSDRTIEAALTAHPAAGAATSAHSYPPTRKCSWPLCIMHKKLFKSRSIPTCCHLFRYELLCQACNLQPLLARAQHDLLPPFLVHVVHLLSKGSQHAEGALIHLHQHVEQAATRSWHSQQTQLKEKFHPSTVSVSSPQPPPILPGSL